MRVTSDWSQSRPTSIQRDELLSKVETTIVLTAHGLEASMARVLASIAIKFSSDISLRRPLGNFSAVKYLQVLMNHPSCGGTRPIGTSPESLSTVLRMVLVRFSVTSPT